MANQTQNNDTPCKVIVVDDDVAVRMVIVALLQDYGAEVIAELDNGAEAMEQVSKLNPDVTFMDINMPVKSGIDALKEIIANDPSDVVMMLTGESDMTLADSCIELGAKNYIRKGASPAVLEIMLKDAIKNHGPGST